MSSKAKTTTTKEEAKPALVPKLRFPEFRGKEGWKDESGDALFDQVNDRNSVPGLPVLAITQEHGAIPRHIIDYHVSVTEKSVESYKVVRERDFIISLRSFQGGIEYSRYHGICSPAYVILRRRGEGSDEYFRHYLKTERFIRILTRNLEGMRDGKMISYAQFSELRVPVPSPAEQRKIAECLSSVDELIADQARKVDALKTHKKGLMQQLFPREGETQPRLRFPEFRIAGEWKMRRLRDFADVSASGDLDFSNFSPERSEEHCFPIYSNAVEKEGVYGFSSVARSKANSVTITARGTLGRAFLRTTAFVGIGRLIVVSNFDGEADSAFLKECWDHLAVIPQEVTSIPQLTAVAARAAALPFPSLSEQQRIASCLRSLDALITAETQKLEALKNHKKGLMQQLFPSPEEIDT